VREASCCATVRKPSFPSYNWGGLSWPEAIGDGFDFVSMGPGAAKGPGQFNFDTTLQKITKITERQSIQFRAEFFNLFNHTQFNAPNTALFASPLPDQNSPNSVG
jgi:hypothetical protein